MRPSDRRRSSPCGSKISQTLDFMSSRRPLSHRLVNSRGGSPTSISAKRGTLEPGPVGRGGAVLSADGAAAEGRRVKRGGSWSLWYLAMVVAGLVSVSPVAARTWRVEKDGSGDYTTIQPAVNGASPGDTIRLGVGRWTEYAPLDSQGLKWIENVYVHVTVDSLTLTGAGADQSIIGPTTVIQPPAEWPKGICSLRGIKRLRVEKLTVEHIRDGMYVSEGLLQVSNCIFRGGHGGIISWGERGNIIESCQFLDNTDNGIIGFSGAGGFIVSRCVF